MHYRNLTLATKKCKAFTALSFGFYLTEQSILCVEDVGDLKLWVEKRMSMFQKIYSPAQLLFAIYGANDRG